MIERGITDTLTHKEFWNSSIGLILLIIQSEHFTYWDSVLIGRISNQLQKLLLSFMIARTGQ